MAEEMFMKLRVLGSAGAEFPDFRPPAFLIDEMLLLDAGTIGSVLSETEQWKLQHIFITHSHLDHIRAIPALADNIIIKNLSHTVTLHATQPVISAMREHLFNNVIWPDFTCIPSPENSVLTYDVISTDIDYEIAGYRIKAIDVDHTVPGVGYIVSKGDSRLAYSGDTGPTEAFWLHASGADALIVEVSFPDAMEELALLTKHLTSSLLLTELKKMKECPPRIFITHPKPQYYETIKREVDALHIPGLELLHDGAQFQI